MCRNANKKHECVEDLCFLHIHVFMGYMFAKSLKLQDFATLSMPNHRARVRR